MKDKVQAALNGYVLAYDNNDKLLFTVSDDSIILSK